MGKVKKKDVNLRLKEDPSYRAIPTQIPSNQLPINKDVGLAIEFYKLSLNLSEKESVNKVALDIMDVYKKSYISTISQITIDQKL